MKVHFNISRVPFKQALLTGAVHLLDISVRKLQKYLKNFFDYPRNLLPAGYSGRTLCSNENTPITGVFS